jgi:stearoyl-CoA desaturase (delta-9 desaturase)
MFANTSFSNTLLHVSLLLLSIIGIFFFDFTFQNYLIILLGYFIYGGIGNSMTIHRCIAHRTFEFSNKIIKWICISTAVMAGRGGLIGWAYAHRLHHAFSDTDKDPHKPNNNIRGAFFPTWDHLSPRKKDLVIVKDLLTKPYLFIEKYYNLILLCWVIFLLLISIELLYFFWIVPVAILNIMQNNQTYLSHVIGYRNHNTKDNSKNIWLYAILLFGDGWHNNHHKNPQSFKMREKWWEFDPMEPIIRLVKK